MRYRFYREHKYVSYRLSEFERLVAKTDFIVLKQTLELKMQLNSLAALMNAHAEHEDKAIHELLRQKGSTIHQTIEADHRHHAEFYQQLERQLDNISTSLDLEEQLALGYQFYLSCRVFVSENLKHLHEEEKIIMIELQKLYTDDELRKIEFNTYGHMTPADMIHMLEVLSPHMNFHDLEFFLSEIKLAAPEKFAEVQNSKLTTH